MPRSRRRHHSKSRSRSRSHSHDRDREPKRRKIESYDSPHHRKSVSSEPEAIQNTDDQMQKQDVVAVVSEKNAMDCSDSINDQTDSDKCHDDATTVTEIIKDLKPSGDGTEGKSSELNKTCDKKSEEIIEINSFVENIKDDSTDESAKELKTSDDNSDKSPDIIKETSVLKPSDDKPAEILKGDEFKAPNKEIKDAENELDKDTEDKTKVGASTNDEESCDVSMSTSETDAEIPIVKDLKITPKKVMSPKQVQKRLESEKKRLEKLKEREEREKKRQEERDEREKKRQEERDEKKRAKEQLRIEKEGQKLKEKEQRDKEKEMKRKEREEKEEQKRKERELEKTRKQQEIDEKNKEKLKLEEQKQKAAAAFVNFFVPKKSESDDKKKENTSSFMPFEIKSDMRLAPLNRRILSIDDKEKVVDFLENQEREELYLYELKNGKVTGKDGKTWIYDDGSDDVTILDDLGESIVEHKPKMKAKFLKFHENQRPPYYGTWRKTSKHVKPRKPLGVDSDIFNYEIDSDDEWEDEEDGEDIVGSDEEDKENESENDNEYELDNDVFVPHGHLSDDEVDGEDEVFNPEAQKAKLKFMNRQFEEERKSKTAKIKPRVIGCVWYDEDKKIDEAIIRYLQPLSVICNNSVHIRKRSEHILQTKKHSYQGLDKEYMPDFLRLLHGNTCKKKLNIIDEYLEYLNKKNLSITVHKFGMAKQMKECAQWMKCPDEGPMFKVPCWYVSEDVQREYNVKLELPKRA